MIFVLFFLFCVFFFFQAEDGIRDLVRSRGLGDVYKRQSIGSIFLMSKSIQENILGYLEGVVDESIISMITLLFERIPVSYTHLTLPTSDLV